MGAAIQDEFELIADRITDESKAPGEADDGESMPLPTDARTIFLGGLFFLAVLAALYVAAEIVLPIVLAVLLKLLLQPFVRVLDRLRVPRGIGALLAIILLLLIFAALGSGLAGPATSWGGKLASVLPTLQAKLAFLQKPMHSIEQFVHQLD